MPVHAPPQVSDTVHMLETMHETHVGHLLPRVAACHTAAEAFAARCLDCKVGRGARPAALQHAHCHCVASGEQLFLRPFVSCYSFA